MMILVLCIESVFRRNSGICHIVYDTWGGYRRALPFSPFYFYVWYHLVRIWMMMETLAFM